MKKVIQKITWLLPEKEVTSYNKYNIGSFF